MHIRDYCSSPETDAVMTAIDSLGLYRHVAELEAYGITVVPPETMRSRDGFIERLRGTIAPMMRTGANPLA